MVCLCVCVYARTCVCAVGACVYVIVWVYARTCVCVQ